MANGGVESPKTVSSERVVIEFSKSDETMSFSSSTAAVKLPKRLRKRLLLEEANSNNKTPSTVEEIESKLRHAHLRRQQFYETLSSKARPKPKSPSRSSSSHEEDLGQRLEAKLQAAEQKRLSILENAQKRLARLDELRQAAKTGVEMRFKRERERLVTKVELRVQKAEENRMLILKATRQRRATLREKRSQSIVRRMARESKHKECVCAAICQKRAAAERKRLGFLEAEKKRACARVLQVRQVANSVSRQRDIERRRMSDQLENRLLRAKRQRAEYLRQRGRQNNAVRADWNQMHKQADHLSRKLARCWRQFLKSRRTTLDLAKDYEALKLSERSAKKMPFEQLARLIESAATLQTVKSLLDRLESRLRVSKVVGSNQSSTLDNIDHLLKRVATPKKRTPPRTSLRSRETKNVNAVREAARRPAKMLRYPVRIVLCAYMILGHPDAVFSGRGEREIALAKSADDFIRQFELLIRVILDGPIQSSDEESDSMSAKRCTFRSQLVAFDRAWCNYLNCFVVWKVKDAQSLEEDLVRAACQLELSMIQKCKLTPEGDSDTLSHDMKAIQKQVTDDQKLLREKIQHLSGNAGIEHMEHALSETRSKYFQAVKNGSSTGSPIVHILSPGTSSSSVAAAPAGNLSDRTNVVEDPQRPSRVVRSLFKEDATTTPDRSSFSTSTSSSSSDALTGGSIERLMSENELIVNEFLHEQRRNFLDIFKVDEENSIKAKIRITMEEAFWDGVMDSIKKDKPSYDRVVELVREVRDGISEMAPESWKQEIDEAIDLDILSQVLRSGTLDIDYLGMILNFALGTLQKLCSPAQEDELKGRHQELLKELTKMCQTQDESKFSNAIAMVKGVRFVLEQIQALKQEMSKARITMLEPLLKGPAGLDYLRKAFTNHYGSHSDACTSLPLTMHWLSSLKNCKDQEWEEHTNSLSTLTGHGNQSHVFLPPATLRTGGNCMLKTSRSEIASTSSASYTAGGQNQQQECSGEKIDLLVRLGLLKLASGISGLTREILPEPFMLNLARLRAVQAEMQKLIVISTSLLVCRQTLLEEKLVASSGDMGGILSKLAQQLLDVLDRSDDVGIEGIVDIISRSSEDINQSADSEKLQSRKLVMARMLAKCLQAGDPVFEKVSKAVYLAARGVVFSGSGTQGRKLAEMALRQVGAVMLTERVVETAEVLVVAATVSVAVHGPWYATLVEKM